LQEDHLGSAMGTFGTIFDVGHASGPLLKGLLIGLTGSALITLVIRSGCIKLPCPASDRR
jgi:hypothetical protein